MASSSEPKAVLKKEKISDEDLTEYDLILIKIERRDGVVQFDEQQNPVFSIYLKQHYPDEFLFQKDATEGSEWRILTKNVDPLFLSVGFPNHREQIIDYIFPRVGKLHNGTCLAPFSIPAYLKAGGTLVKGVDYTGASNLPANLIARGIIIIDGQEYIQFPGNLYKLSLEDYLSSFPPTETSFDRFIYVLTIDDERYGLNIYNQVVNEQMQEEEEEAMRGGESSSSSSSSPSPIVQLHIISDTAKFYLAARGYDKLCFQYNPESVPDSSYDLSIETSPESPELFFYYKKRFDLYRKQIGTVLQQLHEKSSIVPNPLIMIKGMTIYISATYLEFLLGPLGDLVETQQMITNVLKNRGLKSKLLNPLLFKDSPTTEEEEKEIVLLQTRKIYDASVEKFSTIFLRKPIDRIL